MNKAGFAATAVGLALAGLLGAASPAAAAPAAPAGLDRVVLAIGYIPHIQFTPLYVGQAKGFYRDQGIDLVITYGLGLDIFSLLESGKIDVGLSDSDQLILAGSKGMPLRAVYQYYQKYPVSIVARAGRFKDPTELAGKRIGTPELSGTSFIGLELFLRKYALTDKVQVERIGFTQVASLMSGQVDAVVCFSNNEPVQLKFLGEPITEWRVQDFTDMVGSSFISSESIISSRGSALARFARATTQAMAYTEANREEALRIAVEQIGNLKSENMPFYRGVLDATCGLFLSPRGFGYLDAGLYTRSIAELASLGLIPTAYPGNWIVHPLG